MLKTKLTFRWGGLFAVLMAFSLASCKSKQREFPVKGRTVMDFKLPPDCDTAIRIYIYESGKQKEPEKAAKVLGDLAQKYSFERDSPLHACLRCYEGQAWDVLRNGDSIIACYDEVLPYLEAHRDLIGMRAMAYLYIGWAHSYKSQRLTANYYLNKAGNELDDTTYSSDGKYFYCSNYSQPARSALFTEIAQFANFSGLEEQSINYIQSALTATSKMGDSMLSIQAYVHAVAGLIYSKVNKEDSSRKEFQTALPMLQAAKDTGFLVVYYDYLGKAFLVFKKYDSALKAYSTGLEIQKKIGEDKSQNLSFYQGLAEAYLGLKRIPEAMGMLKLVHKFSSNNLDVGLPDRQSISRLTLKCELANQALGKQFSVFLEEADSMFDLQRINSISDMDAQYGLQRKNARIGHLDKENEDFTHRVARQNTFLLVTILLVVLLGIFIAFLRLWQRRKQLRTERDKAVLEQQLLRSQMEPHFLFNTIAVLQSLIRKDEKDRSIKYLSQFARLLRISLENSRKSLVPLNEEVEALQNYLSLQQVRFQDVFTFEINYFEGFKEEADEILIPPMLLQPFVENAIQHGMRGKANSEGRISVNIQKEGKMLRCIISDNGEGKMPENESFKKNSFSTTITRERLELLSRQSGKVASVDIKTAAENDGKGTVVTLVIPFQEA
ncbi:MAG: histidine kinase [Chitinophagaceae bacterium]